MPGKRRTLAFALAAVLAFCALCAGAAADAYGISGNAGETYVFYVESYGYGSLELRQRQGLCHELTYVRSQNGELVDVNEWGKYHVYAESPDGQVTVSDWNSTSAGSTFTLPLYSPGTYRIRVVPYSSGEMTDSWVKDVFICWRAYPEWWISGERNCSARNGSDIRPYRETPPPSGGYSGGGGSGRLVIPYEWDTQFKPGTTGTNTYNDKRYLRLGNLADDNWMTSFDWLIWSGERVDGIPEITARFRRETVSSIGIRNGYLRDKDEYYRYARASGLTVKIRDAYGREYQTYLRIPDEYSTEYRVYSLGGTYSDVTSIEVWLDTFRCDETMDIEHRYVIHIADIQFYQ